MRWTASFLISLCLTLLLAAPQALAAKKIAFVVGIDRYDNLRADQQLKKAVNDARAVSQTLETLGFDVSTAENASRLELVRAWQQFLNRVEPGDITAFFFAGHGVEIGGLNFLLPRDVPKVASGEEEVLKAASLPLNNFLEQLRDKNTQVSLHIIDACRDNPFVDSRGRSIGGGRGLARVEPPTGTFVMFSAGGGQVALDRLSDHDPDPNSVYTRALLKRLTQPGLSLPDIAHNVRREVLELARSVSHVQVPSYYDEVIGRFCPAGCDVPAAGQAAEESSAGAAEEATQLRQELATLREELAQQRQAEPQASPDPAASEADALRGEIQALKDQIAASKDEPKVAVGTFPPSPAPWTPPVLKRDLTLKMQTAFPEDDAVFKRPIDDFAEEVRRLSGGKMRADIRPANTFVASFQVHVAAEKGVIDAGLSVPLLTYGKNTAFGLLDGGVPFGLSPEPLARWYQGEGQSLADQVYAKIGLKMLPCAVFGPYSGGWFSEPLTGPDSYRDVKLRTVGLPADFFTAAGAVVVQLPSGEIPGALKRGVINAVQFRWPLTDYELGLHAMKLLNYYYYPGWDKPAGIVDFVVGLSFWNGLSTGERAVLEQACRNTLAKSLARIPEVEKEGLDKLRSAGVEVKQLPDSLVAQAKALSEGVFREHSQRNSDFKRIHESMSRFQ